MLFAVGRGFSQIVKEHYGMSSIHGEGSLGASTDFVSFYF